MVAGMLIQYFQIAIPEMSENKFGGDCIFGTNNFCGQPSAL